VDPVNSGSPSIVGPNATIGTLVSGFALRQSTGEGTLNVDDITVGDTFCPAEPPTTGACCVTANPGACVIATPAECALIPGVFMGLGTICSGIDCAYVPATKTTWGQLKTIYR
jgi:hypothetical protein